jgi:hypothetical protein
VRTIDVRALAEDTYAEAIGRTHRDDPINPGTGGPAGNARLTAWTGLLLLALFVAELVTLLDVRGLISWHVAIGVLLVPPALVKTASTGWRIVRYYTGDRSYRRAGPPPMPLRVLGPLVVIFTLAVLASGLVLVFIGTAASRSTLITVLGHSADAVSIHKATFIGWAVVTGLHALGRLVPALQVTGLARRDPHAVPGPVRRTTILAVSMIAAVAAAVLLLGYLDLSAWRSGPHHSPGSRSVSQY